MDKRILDLAMKEVIAVKMKAIDIYMESVINPMLDEIKNPEKVIGKKYEMWTDADKQMVGAIYQASPQILSDFIKKKEYDTLVNLQEV